MSDKEIICTMALAKVKSLSLSNALMLYRSLGSAEAVFDHKNHIQDCIPDATERLVSALNNTDEAMKRAEVEMEFVMKNRIRCLCINDDEYPQRLKECGDAPLCLFYCGTANLNAGHIVSMVGTRKCTEYGKDLCRSFIADLKRYCPNLLVVSGLAYGIDIHAHKAAIENGMDTVGVLAHGLDMIYPSVHRQMAAQMTKQGGLLTEYMSATVPDKGNFVRRNRIIAGVCDATIVVESAVKGGGLITAELAEAYHRDVFAFPGRVYDEYSEGCNRLIKDNKAVLIQSAEDFINAMCWENPLLSKKEPRQQELFVELTEEERMIVETLKNVDDKPVNHIVVESGIPYSRVSVLMFELEMKGVVVPVGGARYRLLRC